MNHQELYKLIVTVQKNVRCPQCGKPYGFAFIQIRGIVDSLVFLELSCADHMPLLATVSLSKRKASIPLSKEAITSDDVIETYKFFKDFKGNFKDIFSKETNNKSKND